MYGSTGLLAPDPWAPADAVDLVFSNAALQWVPDHARVFPHLLAQVAPGGALAVQIPAHLASPIHQAMLEVARHPDQQVGEIAPTSKTASHAVDQPR